MAPLAILAVALPFAWNLYNSGPVAERKSRERVPRLVEVLPVSPTTQGPIIEAWGEVVPARRLMLRAEVSGTVVSLHPNFTPGGEIAAGETLLQLSDAGLRSSLAEAEADIAEIRARIAIEDGQAVRAARDAQRSGLNLTDVQRSLVLREPQMAQLVAELAAAEAVRDRAALDLAKTTIKAPFDVLVVTEEVAIGASITSSTDLAELVATDRFSVVLAVPSSALSWIDVTGGKAVALSQPGAWPDGITRQGEITRRGAQLSETGRMVEVIVEVADPLDHLAANTGEPKLLLGSFLKAEIEGTALPGAVALDRAYLRNDTLVWVMRDDGTMEMREVDIAWRGADKVLISGGLYAGDKVVTTNLAVAAPGMKLRVAEPSQ